MINSLQDRISSDVKVAGEAAMFLYWINLSIGDEKP
jgi:hypothetical protein